MSQTALVTSALQGMALCFAMAFIVLNISTGNVISSILAVITVVGIMSAALGIGIVGICGWDLGISESISVVILIGFSLDFSLHIGGARLSDPMSCKWAEPAIFFYSSPAVVPGARDTILHAVDLCYMWPLLCGNLRCNVQMRTFTPVQTTGWTGLEKRCNLWGFPSWQERTQPTWQGSGYGSPS